MNDQAINIKNWMEPLSWLKGRWHGRGKGGFPTHDSFEYADYMRFKIVEDAFTQESIIHFEEIARIVDKGENHFKHWETGFFKPASNGRVELLICHNTGRVEIAYGVYQELDLKKKSFRILFESDRVRNDESTKTVLQSRRELIYSDGELVYKLSMSTTEVLKISAHLEVKLQKIMPVQSF